MEHFYRINENHNIIEKRNTDLKRIIDNRTAPGLLLLDEIGNILSSNSFTFQNIVNKEQIAWILDQFGNNPTTSFVVKTVIHTSNNSYGVRAFTLDNRSQTENSLIVALLIEDVSTDRIDLCKTKEADAIHFTPRENQVIKMLQLGLTDKKIAHKLTISPETVHGYVKSIRAKLGVSTRTGILHKLY